MNKKDYFEKELDRLLTWIRAADARVSLVLPLAMAMLGALAALASRVASWGCEDIILGVVSALPLASSLLFLALATFPRVKGPRGSLIFFGGISEKTAADYRNAVDSLSDEKYVDDLGAQCHVNAQIAALKFRWIKYSLLAIFVATMPWLATIYHFYQIVSDE